MTRTFSMPPTLARAARTDQPAPPRDRCGRRRARGRRSRRRACCARGAGSARRRRSRRGRPRRSPGWRPRRRARCVASQLMPLQHAVAGDVGVDDRGDAGVLEAAASVERGELRGLGPALDRDLAVAGVEADRDAAGERASPPLDQRRIAHRRGADDHAVDALARASPRPSPCRGCRRRAGPASPTASRMRLDRRARSSACRRRRRRGRRRADTRSPGVSKACACAAGSRLNTVARAMSPCSRRTQLAVLQVDGGKQDHGFHFRKLAISASPSFWLFSGWNCVPAMLSRATIARDRAAVFGLAPAGRHRPRGVR